MQALKLKVQVRVEKSIAVGLRCIRWFTTIIVWLGSMVLIYWLFLKITGHSSDTIDVLLMLNAVMLAAMLGGGISIGVKLGKLQEMSKQLASLASDVKKITKDMSTLSEEFRVHARSGHNRPT